MTMVTADDKGRLIIRGTKTGQKYLVKEAGEGWYVVPAPKIEPPGVAPKLSRAEVLRRLKNSKLVFRRSWREMRKDTREP